MSFFILVGAMFPILVARGPASVSSACIDLKESLNKMVREPRSFFKTPKLGRQRQHRCFCLRRCHVGYASTAAAATTFC